MRGFKILIKLLLVLTIFCIARQTYAQDTNAVLKILWQRDFGGGNNLSCSPCAVTFNKADNRLLIAGTSFRPKVYSEGKFWLWEIDQNGKRIRNTVLASAPKDLGPAISMSLIKGLTVSKQGNIKTIGKFDGSTLSFMKMNRQARKIFNKRLSKKSLKRGMEFHINKMIHLFDDSFLLVGSDGDGNGMIIKVDSEGNRLWKKTYDLGRVDFFTDGVAVGKKGDFLIVGCSAERKGFWPVKPSDVYILRCNAKGRVLSEKFFSGNSLPAAQPQVCQLDSENFVVSYDKSIEMKTTDLRIKAFSPDLNVLWERQLFQLKKGLPTSFKIIAVPSGFIVAHSVGVGTLKVYKYDNEGSQLRSLSVDKAGWLGNIHLAYTGSKAFIISGTLPKSKDNRTSDIKVIAIELNQPKKASKKIHPFE